MGAEFRDALKQFNFDVSDQELITIMRKFDPNGDGSIRYDEFCSSVLEEDYKAVEHSLGGQVMHGENPHTKANREAEEKAEDEHKMKQERLNELLGAFREQLFPYKDQIQPIFAETDVKMDGHCDYDTFSGLLTNIGVQVDEEDM